MNPANRYHYAVHWSEKDYAFVGSVGLHPKFSPVSDSDYMRPRPYG
jgi:hypothetical protein